MSLVIAFAIVVVIYLWNTNRERETLKRNVREHMKLFFVRKYCPVLFIELPLKNKTIPSVHSVSTFGFVAIVRGEYNPNCFKCSSAKTTITQQWRMLFLHGWMFNRDANYRLVCGLEVYRDYIKSFAPNKQCTEIGKAIPQLIKDFQLEGEFDPEYVEERLLALFGIPYINPEKGRFTI